MEGFPITINITDYMPKYNRLRRILEEFNLVVIKGKPNTGKTTFIQKYLEELEDVNIKHVDSKTKTKSILNFLKLKNYIHDSKILVYDDKTIKSEILKKVSKIIIKQNISIIKQDISNKFIVIINEVNFTIIPKEYQYIEIDYPDKKEIYRFIQDVDFYRVREKPPKKSTNKELFKKLVNLNPAKIGRIMMSIEDGFFSGVEKKKENFHITNKGNFMLSLAMAENLSWLRKFDKTLIEADKLKNNNDNFYLDFIKLYYPTISRMRLRYPKKIYEIIKKRKNKNVK